MFESQYYVLHCEALKITREGGKKKGEMRRVRGKDRREERGRDTGQGEARQGREDKRKEGK